MHSENDENGRRRLCLVYFQGQILAHLCLSVLLTVISLIVFICIVTYELIKDDDDDDDDDHYQ